MTRERSTAELASVAQAFVSLTLATLAVRTIPFRFIARAIGLRPGERPTQTLDTVDAAHAARIGWAVNAAARRLPWTTTCLMQAIAAAILMRARGLPATLHLGVARADGIATAHAWLQCGELVLTGADEHQQFTELACFVPRRAELTSTTARS